MPEGSSRLKPEKPCIVCGGERDRSYAYTTNQGKRSIRMDSRCSKCGNEKNRARHVADREKSRAQSRAWRAKNREYCLAKSREYQQSDHGKAVKAYHQRLRKARMRSGQKDNEAIRAIYLQAKEEQRLIQPCPVFALPELGYQLQVDHIIPLAKGGGHVAENLQIIPIGINMRKGVKCQK